METNIKIEGLYGHRGFWIIEQDEAERENIVLASFGSEGSDIEKECNEEARKMAACKRAINLGCRRSLALD